MRLRAACSGQFELGSASIAYSGPSIGVIRAGDTVVLVLTGTGLNASESIGRLLRLGARRGSNGAQARAERT